MAIFLTGSTGYIGAHVAAGLLEGHSDRLNLLVRAKDEHEAEVRLWKSLQLHFPFPQFHEYLRTRISIFRGDLTDARFGLVVGRLLAFGANHRRGHPLRRFLEPQI